MCFILREKSLFHSSFHTCFFQYVSLQNLTVGNLAYEMVDGMYTPLSVCHEFYRNSSIDPENETFDIDPHIDKGRKKHKFVVRRQNNVNLILK